MGRQLLSANTIGIANTAVGTSALTANTTGTVIEIRPHRWSWNAFEAPGVE